METMNGKRINSAFGLCINLNLIFNFNINIKMTLMVLCSMVTIMNTIKELIAIHVIFLADILFDL